MGEGMNHRAGFNDGVGNDAVGAHLDACAQAHMAFKNTVHVDGNILRAAQLAPHIEPGRVRQAHALLHQLQRHAPLVGPLQFGQLHRAVDTGHLHGIVDLVRHDGYSIGHGKLHHIGQVVLSLGILVVQTRQPGLQQPGRHCHDAAVHLMDRQLFRCGVFLFRNRAHCALRAARAHDAAIAGGVRKIDGQQRQLVSATRRHQRTQGVDAGQRHIAREHDHDAVIGQLRHRLLHGVAGAQLWLLSYEINAQSACSPRIHCAGCFHFHSTMTGNDDGLADLQSPCSVQHMAQQRATGQRMQHLGQ